MHQANAMLNAKTIRESGLMTVKDLLFFEG